ncbi:MAG: MFS transporter [Candidatus Anaerobiospirillum pullicola]|uniref:MFS transporter n=1 Tax=Candidatus Anaerobiospirillum pullicola TaxID=2838451 RepID=A0A948WXT4_9GAMM|nr:MFS transporter [Candidatus Anaerobiospirillum pullicola]
MSERMSAQGQAAVSKLSFLEKCGFGAGDAACNMLFNPITMFLSFFYTDIFGLAPAVVATMFLVVRMFDAFFDPIYGAWMDNRNSKYGRYRKWMAIFTIPFAISCLIMFYTPDVGPTAKIIYAFATYLLLSILYSCVNIPYCSLGGVITADPVDRVSSQKFRFIGAGLASLFCTFTLLPLVGYFGGGDRATGFFYTISLFAVIAVFLFFFCFFYTRERIQPRPEEVGEPFLASFKKIIHNDQWLVSISLMFLDCIPSFVRGAVSIYFAKYVLGFDDIAASMFLTLGICANIVGAYLTSVFTNRFCKVTVYKAVKIVCIVLSLILFLIPSNQVALIYIVFIVLSVIHQIAAPIIWSFIGDVDDYGEWKLHQRASGLCASGHLFTLKVALAVGGALVGAVLSYTGYEANIAEQTDFAISGIYALMTWIPAIGYFVTFAVTHFFYKLNRSMMARISKDIYAQA